MRINVNVILDDDDPDPVRTPDEIAHAILEAFDADEEKDVVTTFIHRPSAMQGMAGMTNPPIPPATPPDPVE